MEVVEAMEFGLEGEFADERGLGRAIAPDGDGGLGFEPVAEVEMAGSTCTSSTATLLTSSIFVFGETSIFAIAGKTFETPQGLD